MPRLSGSSSAARDLTGQSLRDAKTAISDLLVFANLDPAATDWHGWDDVAGWRIRGESCVDDARPAGAPDDRFWRLRELHRYITGDLTNVIKGTFVIATLAPVTCSWTYTVKDGVTTWPPQRELNEYFLWAIMHLLATMGAERLHRCERPTCNQFFVGATRRAKYCSSTCHDGDAPRRRREQTKAHVRAWAARTSLKSARRSGKRPISSYLA